MVFSIHANTRHTAFYNSCGAQKYRALELFLEFTQLCA